MLAAYRLAGLSALEAYYARVRARTQFGAGKGDRRGVAITDAHLHVGATLSVRSTRSALASPGRASRQPPLCTVPRLVGGHDAFGQRVLWARSARCFAQVSLFFTALHAADSPACRGVGSYAMGRYRLAAAPAAPQVLAGLWDRHSLEQGVDVKRVSGLRHDIAQRCMDMFEKEAGVNPNYSEDVSDCAAGYGWDRTDGPDLAQQYNMVMSAKVREYSAGLDRVWLDKKIAEYFK
jgi:hypothetical protein